MELHADVGAIRVADRHGDAAVVVSASGRVEAVGQVGAVDRGE